MCEVLFRNTVQDWSGDFNWTNSVEVSRELSNNVLYQRLIQNVGKILDTKIKTCLVTKLRVFGRHKSSLISGCI